MSIAYFAFSTATHGGKPLTFPGVCFFFTQLRGERGGFWVRFGFYPRSLQDVFRERERERGRDQQRQTGEKR